MNILICGGTSEADYVLSAFKKSHNRIVVMNDNDETADLLSEHSDLDVIKVADRIIDMGPGGGKNGGRIIAQGTPEEIATTSSPTAEYIKEELSSNS